MVVSKADNNVAVDNKEVSRTVGSKDKVLNKIVDSNVVADSKDKVVSKADNKTADNKVVVSKAVVNRTADSNVEADSKARVVSKTVDNNVAADNKVRVIVINHAPTIPTATRVVRAISNDPIIPMRDKKELSPDYSII